MADFVGGASGPCSNPQLGQTEDYTVTVLANTAPPVAVFTSNYVPGGCQNPIQFTDQSRNVVTSWLWNFGDNTTSTLQNPSHTYAATGTYTVTLTASSANGSNQTSQVVTVQVPCLNYCASSGMNTNVWITNVAANVVAPDPAFSSFTGAERNGYGSYLDRRLIVRLGTTRTLSLSANANFGRTNTVWIDWNQDGTFSNTEMIMNTVSNNLVTFSGQFVVPTSTAFVGLTRMRVIVRLNGNVANPCLVGQANSETEDYLVQVVNPLATLEAQSMPSLSVFPNPTTTGQLHLRLTDGNAAGTYAATVENLLGARVLSTSLQLKPAADAALDLSALPQGIYLLRLQGANGQTALRRIVRE